MHAACSGTFARGDPKGPQSQLSSGVSCGFWHEPGAGLTRMRGQLGNQ